MRNISKEMSRISEERMVSKMKCKFLILFVVAAMATLLSPPSALAAPILGPALASFAVLGAEDGVTNVPTSTIGGNLGATNPSIGGGYDFTSGSLQANTTLAQQAQLDLDAAIVALSAFGVGTTVPGGDLDAFQALASNGGVIRPGTYTVPGLTTPNLFTNLILDGGGFDNAVWVFQMPSALITGTTSTVTVQNVGDGAYVGVYWNVHSAATLNGPTFAGNVLAHDLISSDGDLTINCGRLLSATTKVTLIHDNVSIGCTGTDYGSEVASSGGFDQGPGNGPSGVPVPEPGTMMLLGSGLVGLAGWGRKKLRK